MALADLSPGKVAVLVIEPEKLLCSGSTGYWLLGGNTIRPGHFHQVGEVVKI